MEYEELLNQINKIKKELVNIKKVVLAIWDNERYIEIQKLIEKFEDDIKKIKGD